MSTEVEDYVRQGLHHLTGREERTTFDVDALVREGRRRRHTRRLAATAGLTAAAVGVVALTMGMPRPSSSDGIQPGSNGPSRGAATWEVPAMVPGEIGRVVLPDGGLSVSLQPIAGLAYETRFSCRSDEPDGRIVVDLERGGSVIGSSEARCDGTPVSSGGGAYYPSDSTMTLTVTAPADATAYAVVVPFLDAPMLGEVTRATLPAARVSSTERLEAGQSFSIFVACLNGDSGGSVELKVRGGASGEGEVWMEDTVPCAGTTSGEDFTYTLADDRWATVHLTAPAGATGFAVLVLHTESSRVPADPGRAAG